MSLELDVFVCMQCNVNSKRVNLVIVYRGNVSKKMAFTA